MTPKPIVGIFDSEESLLKAVRAARREGLAVDDALTPYPVHGLDEAMGLQPTRLPLVCFLFGAFGLTATLLFQLWVSVFDWPMNIGGKSFNASPALIPIAFELTVLFAGMGSVAAFLARRGLFPGRRPRFAGLGASDDRFLLVLGEGTGGARAAKGLLESHGALEVKEGQEPR